MYAYVIVNVSHVSPSPGKEQEEQYFKLDEEEPQQWKIQVVSSPS